MPRLTHALSGRTTNRPPVITKLHSFVTYRATAAAIVQNVWQTTRPWEIRMKEIGLPLLLLTALASPAFAADCQPNGIGGSFALTMTVRLPTRCLTKSTAWIRTRIMAAIPVPCPIGQGRMKHWKVHRCRRSKASAADRATVRWRVATGIRPPI